MERIQLRYEVLTAGMLKIRGLYFATFRRFATPYEENLRSFNTSQAITSTTTLHFPVVFYLHGSVHSGGSLLGDFCGNGN